MSKTSSAELRAFKAGLKAEKGDKPKRRHKNVIHVIPAALALAGVAPIVGQSSDGGWDTPVGYLKQGQVGNATHVLVDNMKNTGILKEVATLEIAAFAAKVIGKKLGLNRLGTKELKVF